MGGWAGGSFLYQFLSSSVIGYNSVQGHTHSADDGSTRTASSSLQGSPSWVISPEPHLLAEGMGCQVTSALGVAHSPLLPCMPTLPTMGTPLGTHHTRWHYSWETRPRDACPMWLPRRSGSPGMRGPRRVSAQHCDHPSPSWGVEESTALEAGRPASTSRFGSLPGEGNRGQVTSFLGLSLFNSKMGVILLIFQAVVRTKRNY